MVSLPLACLLLAPLACLVLGQPAFRIANVFSDNAVLQRDNDLGVMWGFADAGAAVSGTFLSAPLSGTTGADGIWRLALPSTPAQSTPFNVTIYCAAMNASQTLSNLLVGDVILYSGQVRADA